MLLRQPTGLVERWAWWEAAMSGQPQPACEEEPHCGFYKTRKWSRGPYVPARVWMDPQDICPITGELMSDECIRMEIDGKEVNPWNKWTWIAKNPIQEQEWKMLRALSPLLPRINPQS